MSGKFAKKHRKDGGIHSRSAKAGLTLPVGRVERFLRLGNYASRISSHTPIFLTAVVQYVISEILNLAKNHTTASKRKRISAAHVLASIKDDRELSIICGSPTIPKVVPKKKKKVLKDDE
jgi:histone H2A